MNLRDFRIGWRLLLQQPAYSVVVTGGLAIGFAACFLLFGFVAFCLNYNSSVPDNERLATVKQRINVFPRPEWQTIGYLPLRDAYFDEDLLNSRAAQSYGRRGTVFGMAAGGTLILLLAAINYINLATVRTLRRQREIVARKLHGAGRADIALMMGREFSALVGAGALIGCATKSRRYK